MQIFERLNKNFLITKAGKEILKKAELILRESEEIKNIAKNFKDPFSGDFRIGAFPTLASYYFPKIVGTISKNFPDLKIFLVEEKTEILLQKLKNGDLDAAFIAMPLNENDLEGVKIFSEEFLLALPNNHILAKKKKVSNKELKGVEMMLLEEGHCLRNQALEACSMLGSFEKQDFRATSLETLRQMVANGLGITLMPEIAIKKDDKIIYVEIENAIKRTIGLYWRKGSQRAKLIHKIIEIIK